MSDRDLWSLTTFKSGSNTTGNQTALDLTFSFSSDAPPGATMFCLCGFSIASAAANANPDSCGFGLYSGGTGGTLLLEITERDAVSASSTKCVVFPVPVCVKKPTTSTTDIVVRFERASTATNWAAVNKFYAWGFWR